jgi:hypothetical protein
MEADATHRRASIALFLAAAMVIVAGLVGISGVWCPRGLVTCPASGCQSFPTCPNVLEYDVFGTLVLLAAIILVPSALLLRRPSKF